MLHGRWYGCVAVAAACGGGDAATTVDAASVPMDATPAVIADNGVPHCGKATIFVSFGGFIMDSEDVDDARLNQSSNSGGTIESLADVAWAEALRANLGPRLAALRIPMNVTRP